MNHFILLLEVLFPLLQQHICYTKLPQVRKKSGKRQGTSINNLFIFFSLDHNVKMENISMNGLPPVQI